MNAINVESYGMTYSPFQNGTSRPRNRVPIARRRAGSESLGLTVSPDSEQTGL